RSVPSEEPQSQVQAQAERRAGRLDPQQRLYFLFLLSGATSLAYELVFTKLLGTIFGTAAYAVATVLASFMAGLALGSAFIGRRADHIRRPLRWYAIAELAIGAYVVATPLLVDLVRDAYVGIYRAHPLTMAWLTVVRFLVGGAVV